MHPNRYRTLITTALAATLVFLLAPMQFSAAQEPAAQPEAAAQGDTAAPADSAATAATEGGDGEAAAASPETEVEESSMFGVVGDYLADGGFVMYVILMLSLVGTVIFIERAYDLYVRRRLDVPAFLSQVTRAIDDERFRDGLAACDVRSQHPVLDVVRKGMLSLGQREKDIERAMEGVMIENLERLSKRIGFMALLANTATLAGLLGTIFGLISAFNSVAAASAAERQEALAAGISQAMYTTAFGITVAVPLLFFHHFLSRRTEVLMFDVESGASAVLQAMGRVRAASNDPSPDHKGA